MFVSAGQLLDSLQVSRVPSIQRAANAAFLLWGVVVSEFAVLVIVSPLMLKDIVGEADAAAWQGTLTSVTAASGLLLCALVGWASDRYGRLVFMRIWVILFFLASVVVLHSELTRTLTGLVFARLLPFSVFGTLTYALTSDLSRDSSEVLKAHQFLGGTFSVAMLLGNVAAGGLTLMFPGNRVWILVMGIVLNATSVWCAFNYLEAPPADNSIPSPMSASSIASSPITSINNNISASSTSTKQQQQQQRHEMRNSSSLNMRRHANSGSIGPATTSILADDDGNEATPPTGVACGTFPSSATTSSEQQQSAGNVMNATTSPFSPDPLPTATAAAGLFPLLATPLGIPDKILDAGEKLYTNNSSSNVSFMEGIALLRKDPFLRNTILSFSLIRVCNINSFSIFILFANHRLGWTIVHVSCYLIGLGLVGAISQAFFLKTMNSLTERVTRGELTTQAAGEIVLKVFWFLMLLTVPTCAWYGLATSSAMMFLVTIPAGVCAILPGIFTAKISAIAKEHKLTGWSLGLVGTTQNLIESVLGIVFGYLLKYALTSYADNELAFGLPYYVNAVCYACVCLLMYMSHVWHGTNRTSWTEFEVVAAGQQQE